jgi:predicted metal-dependent peptidase
MLSRDEYLILSRELQKYHEIFDKFWKITNIVEDETVKTAVTAFDPEDFKNTLAIKINPSFWISLSLYQKVFLICHEYLHILLLHGFRIFNMRDVDKKRANVAADLIVHIFILEKFGMDKEKIDPDSHYYWIQNIFPNESTDNTFEFFYNKLLKMNDKDIGDYALADSHDGFSGITSVDQIVKFVNENLSEDGKKSLKRMIDEKQAGTNSLGESIEIKKEEVKKLEFEKLIQEWLNMRIKIDEREEDVWTRENRRIKSPPHGLILPAEYDYIHQSKIKEKLDVYIFLDASGSCAAYINKFYALTSIINLNYFTPYFFTFDTEVFTVENNSKKLRGGGGTSFKNIEKFLLKLEKYPDSIFVLTDGHGDFVYPRYPERWLWFVTDNYMMFIPKDSKAYNIRANIKFKN